ncbi:MAG: dienelactone hydrolase family protein [Smithellaceae bacterium]|nr:dienelactone hydrolase family protein [Smithellaceae bacterium]
MDRDHLFHNEGRRFSRRMVLKLLGWFTVAVGMVKIPGMARAQEKLEIISDAVRFPGRGVTLGGFFARPAGRGPFPGVVVIHENRGITDYIKEVTRNLATAGYASLSVNLVSRGLGPDYPGGSDEALNALGKLSDDEAMADLDAGVEYLKQQPVVFTNSIGCMGFCMGGRYSLLFGAHNKEVKATVVFYGRPINKITPLQPKSPVDLVPELASPLLGNFGDADAGIPVDDVKKLEDTLRKHNKTFDFKIYPGAKHAFHREGPNYQAEAARDSWKRTLEWFARYLPAPIPQR